MPDYVLTLDDEDTLIISSPDETTVLQDSEITESLVTGEISTVDLTVDSPGVAGPPNILTIGTVTLGDSASASITGTSPAQVLNLVFPKYSRHVHTQGTPSTTWTITHALGGYPAVSVVDSSRTVVFGEVNYLSTTQVVVNFSAAFSGYAYLT
jgi:hypothetical protein